MFKQVHEILNTLLDSVLEGVIVVDENQKIVEINKSAAVMFGYGRKELLKEPLKTLIPQTYHVKHSRYFKDFVKERKQRPMGHGSDVYGSRKDGTIFPIEASLNPFKIYGRNYIMTLIVDITKRKEHEHTLAMKSKALQSSSNGIIITDALKKDNPIIYFNPAFAKLTGYSKEEILNKNCRFLQADDRSQDSIKEIRQAIKEGRSYQTIIRNYKKDGTLFWNDLSITPIKDKDGTITNFIGIQNDITERKKLEQEKNHLAKIFEESLNEIYVFDAQSLKFINVNHGAQLNIGYSMEELISMTPLDIKPNFTESKFRKEIGNLEKDSIEKIEFETIHRRKSGTTYPVNVHLQRSKLGNKDVYVAIILDITEQKNYTAKLEQTVKIRTEELQIALAAEKELNELKTKFLSMVSHEFKTPLSGILTSTMLLKKYELTEQQDKRNKHINTISDKVHYLNTILNDFLSVEKLEKGKVNYKFTNFKLSKVLNEVIYNANMLLKNGQKINYPENIDDISLFQDEKILELILSNLIYNAIKYSSENTMVDINICQNETSTIFKIKDNGIGIPEKDQKNIFNRYFRAENVLLMQGTGIGLNIVKDHLENLNGSITFESREHKGSTFTIELPNKAQL
ncbi:sensor histidine kinase [Winogradskyella schleiferi]|uniref:sensor histidine kinase n=1 Tax=Winogradskyella schleiferi TaxID=2686078 RepID=UPI0015BE0E86|nr:PAS domain S-box protein [Winogradskyella schleiferi]